MAWCPFWRWWWRLLPVARGRLAVGDLAAGLRQLLGLAVLALDRAVGVVRVADLVVDVVQPAADRARGRASLGALDAARDRAAHGAERVAAGGDEALGAADDGALDRAALGALHRAVGDVGHGVLGVVEDVRAARVGGVDRVVADVHVAVALLQAGGLVE